MLGLANDIWYGSQSGGGSSDVLNMLWEDGSGILWEDGSEICWEDGIDVFVLIDGGADLALINSTDKAKWAA